jgi:hypothetical protein
MNGCLSHAPSGATLYAAACVAALQAQQAAGPAAAQAAEKQALTFLRQAFHHGYGQDRAEGDRDLDGIREHPDFRLLLTEARRDR